MINLNKNHLILQFLNVKKKCYFFILIANLDFILIFFEKLVNYPFMNVMQYYINQINFDSFNYNVKWDGIGDDGPNAVKCTAYLS